VSAVTPGDLRAPKGERSATIAAHVAEARVRQAARFAGQPPISTNAACPAPEIEEMLRADADAEPFPRRRRRKAVSPRAPTAG